VCAVFYNHQGTVTHLVTSFTAEFLATPQGSISVGLGGGGITNPSLLHVLYHYWIIATEAFIVAGLSFVTWRRKALRVNTRFLLLSFASIFLMLVTVVLPSFAASLGGYRFFSLGLLFLAPIAYLV
jgi:uncharacterized membrane protein